MAGTQKVESADIVYRYSYKLSNRPGPMQIANAAKGAVFRQMVKNATQADMDVINKHACDYFKTHPAVNRLLYEVYITNGNVRVSSREQDDAPPDGIVIASCLKYRGHVARHERKAYSFIGTRWTFDRSRERDLKEIRQLSLKNA